MSRRIDWDEFLAVCRSGELDRAMASAFSVGDTSAMLVVSIFDNGSIDRLALLVDRRPETAAEIVLAGVDKNDHEHHLTKLAYAALGKYGHQLILDDRQTDLALTRLSDDGNPIDAEHSVPVLSWVADHDGARARAFARRHVGDATISAPHPLELKAADLLGGSEDPEDHAALLEFAGEYLDAGHPSHHGDLAGRRRRSNDSRRPPGELFVEQLGSRARDYRVAENAHA